MRNVVVGRGVSAGVSGLYVFTENIFFFSILAINSCPSRDILAGELGSFAARRNRRNGRVYVIINVLTSRPVATVVTILCFVRAQITSVVYLAFLRRALKYCITHAIISMMRISLALSFLVIIYTIRSRKTMPRPYLLSRATYA